MIDRQRLREALDSYKRDFPIFQWRNEQYKWQAVQCFQRNWDVSAADFAGMLAKALSRTINLLASVNYFPAGMIVNFAKAAPEEVRSMFLALFDEGAEIWDRIDAFKARSAALLERYGDGAKQHFQYENAITVYLWLRYPDKYYIYKYSEVRATAKALGSEYRFKKGDYAGNIRNFFRLYDEINAELKRDEELSNMLRERLDDSCYPDPELRTLTMDFGFYISRYLSQTPPDVPPVEQKPADVPEVEERWIGADYDPGLREEDWLALLADPAVFNATSLTIMRRMKDIGGAATCKQLAAKYGENFNFYNTGASALARRVAERRNLPMVEIRPGEPRWWPILFLGREAEPDDAGVFIWKLRDALSRALDRVDLSGVPLYAPSPDEGECGYWWLTVNPKIWSISELPVGGVQSYSLYNEDGHKRRIFQNFLDARAGDRFIGYESSPVRQVVALGRIRAAQDGERISFEKTESLASPIDYRRLKECPELARMEYFRNSQGSLFRLTKEEYDFLLDLIREENPARQAAAIEPYSKRDFLNDVYMSEQRYDRLAALLRYKGNVILQGAPGVGKTYAARRLAWSLMGEKDDGRIEFVQFHQSYSYEDFVMGYKPVDDGFALKYGAFYRFCQRAANRPDEDFFFIIDEINRGNLSRIFGELLMLIERGYRGAKVSLAYSGMPFSVPENLYIIGMMNTADRSLALIDYALRRRFGFFEMEPAFDSEGFFRYQQGLNSPTLDALIEQIRDLNREIASDRSLGKGFCIGHSYFCECEQCTDEWLRVVVECDILPMLREYWFDDDAGYQRWENRLRGVFQ